ncbi:MULTISPECIES: hypothetical protein [unclassified Paenibacillus]|nr:MULTISPECIES: hypothetical protein [unclassified Paenibacillus]SIR71604.1 hypothetical protein SAMN05880555_4873 [Paenibacillus sp. RU4X]SIR78976.1 hypothetical protein SAMN05880570_4875 [Paenibacillus sp. RU4T]
MAIMNGMAMMAAGNAAGRNDAPTEYVTYRDASFPEVSTDHE